MKVGGGVNGDGDVFRPSSGWPTSGSGGGLRRRREGDGEEGYCFSFY